MFIGGAFYVFYSGGLELMPRPGKYQLRLSRGHISIVPTFRAPDAKKFKIAASKLKGVSMDYEIADSQLSAGKAIAGGIIAGGVGAIAGASMGGKKVTPTLVISFIDDTGNNRQLPLEGSKLDSAHKMMIKKYKLY